MVAKFLFEGDVLVAFVFTWEEAKRSFSRSTASNLEAVLMAGHWHFPLHFCSHRRPPLLRSILYLSELRRLHLPEE